MSSLADGYEFTRTALDSIGHGRGRFFNRINLSGGDEADVTSIKGP
jgi:hypothetical protein